MTLAGPAPTTWTIGAILKWAADDFRGRGIESPRLDAEVLLAFALRSNRVQLIVDSQRPLVADELARFRELVKRRRVREPVAYLLGRREFYGRPFLVDKRVLIPRPDTEFLVDVGLSRSSSRSMGARVLDLCTGSGCVAITLARERTTTKVHATDQDDGALAVARQNALALGAYNVSFSRGDLYEGLRAPYGGAFDLIVSNPPYIPAPDIPGLSVDIRGFEPHLALDGGSDGLDLVRRVIDGAPPFLAVGGALAVEIGAGEADDVAACFEARGFTDVTRTRDYGKIERIIHGVWTGKATSRSAEPFRAR
jgi:release factor glutamine methyltransferase